MSEHFLRIAAPPPFFLAVGLLLLSNSSKSEQNWETREWSCRAAEDEAGRFLTLTANPCCLYIHI